MCFLNYLTPGHIGYNVCWLTCQSSHSLATALNKFGLTPHRANMIIGQISWSVDDCSHNWHFRLFLSIEELRRLEGLRAIHMRTEFCNVSTYMKQAIFYYFFESAASGMWSWRKFCGYFFSPRPWGLKDLALKTHVIVSWDTTCSPGTYLSLLSFI